MSNDSRYLAEDNKIAALALSVLCAVGIAGTGCGGPTASLPKERIVPSSTNPWYGFNHPWLGVPEANFPKPLIDEVIHKLGPPPSPKDYHQSPAGRLAWQKALEIYLAKIKENFNLEEWKQAYEGV